MEIRIATTEDMSAIFDLRTEVFVNEQGVDPVIELDAEDSHAIHVIALEDGVAVGCGRILLSPGEAHIGRLAVKKDRRGLGIGAAVCAFIMEYCRKNGYPYIWLNSQLHAKGFYEKLGFRVQGEVFREAGIEHVKMKRTYTK